jgi:hypothetical protein
MSSWYNPTDGIAGKRIGGLPCGNSRRIAAGRKLLKTRNFGFMKIGRRLMSTEEG